MAEEGKMFVVTTSVSNNEFFEIKKKLTNSSELFSLQIVILRKSYKLRLISEPLRYQIRIDKIIDELSSNLLN